MAFALAAPAASTAIAEQYSAGSETLIVIVTDYAGTPRCAVQQMRSTMDHLLSSTGIRMEWVWRSPKEAGVRRPTDQAMAGIPQVLINIVADKPSYFAKNHSPLGLMVMGSNHTAIHVTEIQKLAEQLRLELGQLMAHVAVHEIGHWLLGRDHATFGIMLKDWGGQDFRMMLRHRVPFSAAQARRIHEELQNRRARLKESMETSGLVAAKE
ncbi:hypothetical protein [uncultured Paludibaculum sp.]|uniref:hypothetical protein n=1 Tax=uncultured Paludibaculum sp. TaxID=1765020 RepID=UPI00374D4676